MEPEADFRRPTRMRRLGLLIVVLVGVSGCGAGEPSSALTDVRAAEVPTVAAPATANLTLIVTNVVDRADRIKVDVNGKRAVDATFPASADRSHPPIFEYRFAVPEGKTAIRVTTPRETKTLRFVMPAQQRWVVMQNQHDDPEHIPMSLELWDERPAFG